MTAVSVAAVLLALVPVVGAATAGHPALVRVWSASREEQLRIVGAHRAGWAFLNAGFLLATVSTAAGVAVLPPVLGDDPVRAGVLASVAVAYAIGGGLWCAVVAIRARTTPTLADLVARDIPTEPGETLLTAAMAGLFAAFSLLTGTILV